MTVADFTLALFCRVDDMLCAQPKHVLAGLYPSEVVTLAMLQVLRGDGNRAFYRWLTKEWAPLFPHLPERTRLFPHLPERTRLFRLFVQHHGLCEKFLAQPTLFGVADSFGIELLHPWRERRSVREVARKGLSNHRWIVGAKLAVVTDDYGRIVGFEVAGANVHDTTFHTLIQRFEKKMIVLADQGFHAKDTCDEHGQVQRTDPLNVKVCAKGCWNERMIVETVFSLFTTILKMKKLTHRLLAPLQARLAYTCAIFNLCTTWHGDIKLQLAPFAL